MLQQVNKKLGCIDLFAGAGGFSLAAAQSGFSVRLAIENDKHASRTLSDNIAKFQSEPCKVISEDILHLNPRVLASETFQGSDECDLVLGGPPCQGFSTHRIRNAGVGDDRNKLINTYFEFVEAFQPSAFLMENVPGMLWDRHRSYLEEFYYAGREAGYEVHPPAVLDARDFGVPQRRKRVFILGTRKDRFSEGLTWPPDATHVNPTRSSRTDDLLPWNDCSSAFLPARNRDPNDVHMNHTAELVQAFANTPHNGGSRNDSNRVLPCHKNHDGHKDVYGRIDPASPAPTMTTACINPSKGRFVHPTEDHGITLRQAARIQTFPDDVVFHGGLMAAGKQIGNAVPIALGVALLKHLHHELRAVEADDQLQGEVPGRVAAE